MLAAVLVAALALTPSYVQGAAIAQSFVAPAPCPTCQSSIYVGANSMLFNAVLVALLRKDFELSYFSSRL